MSCGEVLMRVSVVKKNDRWYVVIEDRGGQATGLSVNSVESVAMTVHRMLRDAVRWGMIYLGHVPLADDQRAGRIELAGFKSLRSKDRQRFQPSPVASIVATESPG